VIYDYDKVSRAARLAGCAARPVSAAARHRRAAR